MEQILKSENILQQFDTLPAEAKREVEEQTSMLGTSVVVQMELLVGCRNKEERNKLNRFLKRFQIVGLSEAIGNKSIELLNRYHLRHGLLIPDSLIAATALTMDYPLLSKNQRDYRFIEEWSKSLKMNSSGLLIRKLVTRTAVLFKRSWLMW